MRQFVCFIVSRSLLHYYNIKNDGGRNDPSRLPELVESLAEAKAAALAIKPARFLHDLPAEMITMSDRYHLPIIEIPTGIPFVDITHAVMEQVLDRQAGLLRRAEEVYRTLTTMVLENSGIQAVVDNVAELVKSPVRVIDFYGEIRFIPAGRGLGRSVGLGHRRGQAGGGQAANRQGSPGRDGTGLR